MQTPRKSIIFQLIVLVVWLCGMNQVQCQNQKIDFPQSCIAIVTGNYAPCIVELATQIWKLHQWGEDQPITICGINCVGNVKGRFSGFEWKWDGKFQCEAKAPGIIGQTTKVSQQGAIENAIQDFLTKAVAAGKIKPEDFKC
ncbi:unnamed protein product [Didymodactylos carnosus]|uniref:Uncharacterized protein n=1 Tax=Didymodactylos carnosus TaxID=1234261 RepID=A0A815N2C1_9BILA|nr:unnamed protein product [Didymodactylos carnosus]CAF1429146.1 unnamed protein product [Didymodactylos carnosus]CAF3686523.1 unnamed protein product [Didymodactylos carnosus]CAF4308498.1 unnamed protein product [Didymodactylos carnosus]